MGCDNLGSGLNIKGKIKWETNYKLKAAYALTYRYGRPVPHGMWLNGVEVEWNKANQAGPELNELHPNAVYFATHAKDITNLIVINTDTIIIDFPDQDYQGANTGWWGIYVVILYESPDITEEVCNRIYVADRSQETLQSYHINTPAYNTESPVLFAIHSGRLTGVINDESRVVINGQTVGDINGADSLVPMKSSGVQGHYYYENGIAGGLNGDIANNTVESQDGIAIINEYLIPNNELQNIILYRVHPHNYGGYNPHPSFNITYTPTCSVSTGEMLRSYSNCFLQSPTPGQPDYTEPIELSAIPGYDHYAWTPAAGLNDSTLANPVCVADSSGWYRVSMWNDDDAVCAQTIPVFVTVGKVPRPNKLQVLPSSCPTNTGKIIFADMDGKAPFQYTVNGVTKTNDTFGNLPPGNYELSVQDAQGCRWDTTVTVGLTTIQTAEFRANPQSGYSPLQVVFQNESTNATSYAWQIDGVTFSTSANYTGYTFADSGTYVVSLIAYLADLTCADTAFATIRVAQGLKMIVPNIITPNNDGRNDALVAQTGGVAAMRWEVRNRWGNLIHSGEATNPPQALTLWNPEENRFPDGVYTVIITARGNSGEMKDFGVQVVVK